MEFKTSISKMTDDDHIIRGEKLSDLVASSSFSDAIFLIMRGKKPTQDESKIFAAVLVSIIDHGMGTPSSMASRFIASGGASVNSAIAGGVLALGEYHGGAIEKAMEQLTSISDVSEFVEKCFKTKEIIAGFGHKIYKDADPRVIQIVELCKQLGYDSKYLDLIKLVELEIEKQKGKKIPINIDGVMAAILLAMGFSSKNGKAIFVIGRTPGLAAQVVEELEQERPVRRIDEEEITYKP